MIASPASRGAFFWWARQCRVSLVGFNNPMLIRGPVQTRYLTLPGPETQGPYQNLGVEEPTGVDQKSRWEAGSGEVE